MVKPGDIGLMRITGPVGLGIRVGQWTLGDGFKDLEHAVVVTSVHDNVITAMEARPGGAGIVTWSHDIDDGDVKWLTLAEDLVFPEAVVQAAYDCMGVPYSFLDYAAIALHRFGISAPGLRDYIANSHHMICSQMVDYCYQRAGVELFDDGRWNGYVTPADLWSLEPLGKLVPA